MNKSICTFSVVLIFSIFAFATKTLSKNDFTTWPGAEVKEFGCFLEKEFGFRDKKFNCELRDYKNESNPCKGTDEYYEGPQFPKSKAKAIDRRITSVGLSWEHGRLQNVLITLDRKYSKKVLAGHFKLPAVTAIQNCNHNKTCLSLIGFDHIGAGDVNCGPAL